MAKTLRVIDPFFIMELGDIFEYDENTKMYVSKRNEEFYKVDDTSVNEIKSAYKAEFTISEDYATKLIEDGFLEEAPECDKPGFINVFDEIDNLLIKYKKGIETINKDCAELPACVKVERETVLNNLVTLLEHLKSLKK
jgi:hypothetical protein